MREIARIEGNSFYDEPDTTATKGNFSKFSIVLCAVAGILIGGLAFRAANSQIGLSGSQSISEGQNRLS